MTELEANLGPYYLEVALASDRADGDGCFVLDVSRDDDGESVASLKQVVDKVDEYFLHFHDFSVPISKLYVLGDWNLAQAKKEDLKLETSEQTRDDKEKPQKCTLQEQEWYEAGEKIMQLIPQMPMLKELTWISGLPLMACVLEKLPPSLTKLVLDLGEPVCLHQDGDLLRKSYIAPNEMKPLQQQTELKELRLFRMHDSLQPIIWETVFRNTSAGGMRVLDLQMAAAPLVRCEHWRKAEDVIGLTVPNKDSREKEYKGMDGKGILHYSVGTGEYLDDFCMRKARIASGFDEAKPVPLYCLKLDGFVIDHLPFLNELSQIVLLSCGENCVDAGLRATAATRTVSKKWSKTVDNAATHCLIQWPNWTGVFDNQGQQLDVPDQVVAQRASLFSIVEKGQLPPQMPLTEESLHMKELKDTLDGIIDVDETSISDRSTLLSSLAVETPLRAVSNASMRGSEVPTLPFTSFTDGPQPIPHIDGFIISYTDSTEPVLVPVISAETSNSPPAADGIFDQGFFPDIDNASIASTIDSEDAIATENTTPKLCGFKRKVRRCLGRLTGSSQS